MREREREIRHIWLLPSLQIRTLAGMFSLPAFRICTGGRWGGGWWGGGGGGGRWEGEVKLATFRIQRVWHRYWNSLFVRNGDFLKAKIRNLQLMYSINCLCNVIM